MKKIISLTAVLLISLTLVLSLSACGNSVDASGYEKWPRGYKEVKAAVGALFKTLAKDARLD